MASVLLATVKALFHGVFLMLAFPMALFSGFGRNEGIYIFFAQACSLAPGIIGDFLRTAYYRLTLQDCPLESRIQFGSFFAHPQVKVGRGVYIGSFCVLGKTSIGDRSQIATGVQILSGRYQHGRTESGTLLSAEESIFEVIEIGTDCWIGAAAIVMADVGAGSTIGAGAIVTKPVPPGSVAVGNPARIVKSTVQEAEEARVAQPQPGAR